MEAACSRENLFADAPTSKVLSAFCRTALCSEETEECILLRTVQSPFVNISRQSFGTKVFECQVTTAQTEYFAKPYAFDTQLEMQTRGIKHQSKIIVYFR